MARWFEKYASNAKKSALDNLMSGMKWAVSAYAAEPNVLTHLQEAKRHLEMAINIVSPKQPAPPPMPKDFEP
jgi:hypothetical protein